MSLVALLLISGLAHAQDTISIRNCAESSPIAGTAGYRNARSAMTTNAQTYGAATHAERALFPALHAKGEDSEGLTFATTIENAMVFSAARVPSVENNYPTGGCPGTHRLSMRGLDLGAADLGLGLKYGPVGVFYAGSVTWSTPGHPNTLARGMLAGTYLGFGWVGSAFAPLIGQRHFEYGLGGMQSDYILGAAADLKVATAEAAYVGSQGGYGHIRGRKVPLFGAGLVEEDFSLPFFRTGLEHLESKLGFTSAFVRRLPIHALPAYDADGTPRSTDAKPETSLETGHFEQRNMGGVFDVVAAVAWKPDPALYQAQVAFHTRDFPHDAAQQMGEEGTVTGFMVQGGIVNVPDAWYYGVEGGPRFTARAELVAAGTEDAAVFGRVLLLFNDADLLALYPYAVNTFGVSWDLRVAI